MPWTVRRFIAVGYPGDKPFCSPSGFGDVSLGLVLHMVIVLFLLDILIDGF